MFSFAVYVYPVFYRFCWCLTLLCMYTMYFTGPIGAYLCCACLPCISQFLLVYNVAVYIYPVFHRSCWCIILLCMYTMYLTLLCIHTLYFTGLIGV